MRAPFAVSVVVPSVLTEGVGVEPTRGALLLRAGASTADCKSGALPLGHPSTCGPGCLLDTSSQLLLIFRTGDAPGKHRIKLVIEGPNGTRDTVKDEDVTLSDQPNGGINIKTIMTLAISAGGLFLVDVFLDGKLMTRMPLKIEILRIEMPTEEEPKKKP